MADEGSPLLRLAAPRTLARKKRGPAFPPPPDRKPAQHGQALDRGLGEVRRHFDEAVARLPSFATDVPYVRIELAPNTFVSDAELGSIGLVPVYRREDAILAAYGRERDLRTFQRVRVSYHGIPLALATIEMHGMSVAVLVPSSRLWRDGFPAQSPVPLMRAAMRSRGTA